MCDLSFLSCSLRRVICCGTPGAQPLDCRGVTSSRQALNKSRSR